MERNNRWMPTSLMDEMIDEKIAQIKDLCRIGKINAPDFLHYLEVIEKGGDLIEFPAELKKSIVKWLPKPNMRGPEDRYFMGVDMAHSDDECKAVLYQKLPYGYKPLKVILDKAQLDKGPSFMRVKMDLEKEIKGNWEEEESRQNKSVDEDLKTVEVEYCRCTYPDIGENNPTICATCHKTIR